MELSDVERGEYEDMLSIVIEFVGCWVVGWSGLWVLTRISAELCR